MKQSLLFICFPFLFSIHSFGQSPGKYILLEEFSTAPCGFCPDGDLIAEKLIKDYPSIIWVTHHAGFGTDSMTINESKTIAGAFTTFAPGAAIDRGDYKIPTYTMPPYIAVSRQKWDTVCLAHLNDLSIVDVGITNSYNSTTRMFNCTVDTKFSMVPESGDMRVNIYLVEDSVSKKGSGYDQKNYLNTQVGHRYYQKGDPIIGYVHHHVLRKVLTGSWGVSGVIPANPAPGVKYSKTYSNIAIPANWKTKDMDVVAFVSYFNSNAAMRPVINSNHKLLLDATLAGINNTTPKIANISVYPNPASDKVFIQGNFSDYDDCKLQITNNTGQVIRLFNIDENRDGFSIENLPNGIYFYKIIGNNLSAIAGKLVVIH